MTAPGSRAQVLRLFVHALDRTGPPMLALAYLRWVRRHHPERPVEVVAFRGGPLEPELAALAPVRVVLDDEEPWDCEAPDDRWPARRARLEDLGPAVNLLVSVAAAQALPLVPAGIGPVAVWSVEVGDDLHWLDRPVGLDDPGLRWAAGSAATATELAARLGAAPPVIAEFIDPTPVDPSARDAARTELVGDRTDDPLVVVGAGIGTLRKGVDLFAEAAVLHRERGGGPARFAWFGGTRDPIAPLVATDVRRRRIDHLALRPAVADLDRWLAAADVLLHPARADAFPLVCLHAAAQGTPVVGFSGVGGLVEMFGPDTLAAPYPDLPGLVDHLGALADPGRRQACGEAQRDRVDGRFVAEAAAPTLDAFLADVAGGWSA